MSQQLSKEQLISIANQFGTPVYVYHAEKIEEQLNELQQCFCKLQCQIFLCLQVINQHQYFKVD